MSGAGTPTYDQLRIFLAVVDSGSFAGAGRALGRATSVVSYGIANLETQLGLRLFDREGTRRPILTEAGRAVLADARMIAHGMDGLRARATGMLDGLEAEVSLAVDVMLPTPWLAHVLDRFHRDFPTVSLRLHVEALGAVAALVLDRRAVIGVSGPLSSEIAGAHGIDRMAIGSVHLVPVAAPSHPLANIAPLPPGAGRGHIQLVLSDRSPLTEGRDFSVASDRSWRLADLGAKHALLRAGIGWGNMPLPLVEADLASGALVRLAMPDHPGQDYRFDGIWRTDAPPGPAGRWLLARFVEQCEAAVPR